MAALGAAASVVADFVLLEPGGRQRAPDRQERFGDIVVGALRQSAFARARAEHGAGLDGQRVARQVIDAELNQLERFSNGVVCSLTVNTKDQIRGDFRHASGDGCAHRFASLFRTVPAAQELQTLLAQTLDADAESVHPHV